VPILNVPSDVVYVEPFVGGANMMAAMRHVRVRRGSDANRYIIALHQAIQSGWHPPAESVNREVWERCKAHQDDGLYEPHEVGFIGFGASMQGAFFRKYVEFPNEGPNPTQKDNVRQIESCRNVLLKAKSALDGVEFQWCDYDALSIPDGAYVYCDPPYAGTAGYSTGKFNHTEFWEWARRLRERCTVRVSEFSAPDDWRVVWEQERPLMGSGAKRRLKTERLFA
jgi:DNA adenine methylase